MVKRIFLTIAFCAVLFCTICTISRIFTVPGDDYRNFQWVRGFYKEPQNSLDIVFVGGSNVYAFVEPPLLFKKYGVTSWSFATNSQPFEIAEYLIKEARKRQPDALYVVSISGTSEKFSEPQMHYILDHFPPSKNKLELTKFMLDYSGYAPNQRAEFYVPLVRYHSRWKKLRKNDFNYVFDGYKSASHYNAFLKKSQNVTAQYTTSLEQAELPQNVLFALNGLLDYLDSNGVRCLFFKSPQALAKDFSRLQKMNTIAHIITERGYAVFDGVEDFYDMGLLPETDFYNEKHTNIHGAIKNQDYLMAKILETYDFTQKRAATATANATRNTLDSWNKSFESYYALVKPNLTEKECESYEKFGGGGSKTLKIQQVTERFYTDEERAA